MKEGTFQYGNVPFYFIFGSVKGSGQQYPEKSSEK